jgi:hypothetical protein
MNNADVGNGAALDAEMLDLLVEDVSAETELNEDGCCLGSFGTEGTCGSFGGTFGTFGTLGSLGCACI